MGRESPRRCCNKVSGWASLRRRNAAVLGGKRVSMAGQDRENSRWRGLEKATRGQVTKSSEDIFRASSFIVK